MILGIADGVVGGYGLSLLAVGGSGTVGGLIVTCLVALAGSLLLALNKTGMQLAVGTGGLSVLAQAATDRVAGVKDNCAGVLAEVGDHPPITH